jgi:magnesium-dependent phosphatase-1
MTKIKLVVFDADDVVFSSSSDCYIGQVTLPLIRIGNDIVKDAAGCKIILDEDVRFVLDELRRRGIHISMDSINRPREAAEVLHTLDLDRLFEHPKINFSDKGANVMEILREFREDGTEISPDEVMFIDDVAEFCQEVKKVLGGKGVVLQMNKDIPRLSDLLGFL